MGEDPDGGLRDKDEPREPLTRPLAMRLRDATNSVAIFIEQAEEGTFPADDRANREMFRAALEWLEVSVDAARRVYVAQMRRHHRRRARKMEIEDRLAGLDVKVDNIYGFSCIKCMKDISVKPSDPQRPALLEYHRLGRCMGDQELPL